MSFPYSKSDLKSLPANDKIEAVLADGMWYSFTKWKKLAKVSEEELNAWIDKHLANGYLIQSGTGAKSYRISYDSVIAWHKKNNIKVGEPIFDFIFPARVWDNQTEVEALESAPLREVGIITFQSSPSVAKEIQAALLGVAHVREVDPCKYKAYSLSAEYTKAIIQDVFSRHTISEARRIYSRTSSQRRELVDLSDRFAHHMMLFYRSFAKTLVKKEMNTIRIYIPEPQDQESQIVSWIITAIEKFDERQSVPFSGYLNSVLKRWPYDLPNELLGQDLSSFQRGRSKAVARLKERGDAVTNSTLAKEMGMRDSDFMNLEEKHEIWIKMKSATTLTWDENSEEKSTDNIIANNGIYTDDDLNQGNALSVAALRAGLNTGRFSEALLIVSQIGADSIDHKNIEETSEEFITELGKVLGVE